MTEALIRTAICVAPGLIGLVVGVLVSYRLCALRFTRYVERAKYAESQSMRDWYLSGAEAERQSIPRWLRRWYGVEVEK